MLTKKTFNAHRRLYYDCGCWIKKTNEETDEDTLMEAVDFDIMPDEDTDVPCVPSGAPPIVDFDSDNETTAVIEDMDVNAGDH